MKRQNRTHETEYVELINKSDDRQNRNNPLYNPPTIEIKINEGDTLQSLSIRYHCPVAELKRLNNLHRENEIYARHSIKVPYRAFSMVAIHRSGDSSPNAVVSLKKTINPDILQEKLASVTTNNVPVTNGINNEQNKINVNDVVFNTKIAEKPVTNEIEDISDEEVQLLPQTNENLIQSPRYFDCNGSDWGLSWPLLLCTVILIVVVVPLIYIFYITEHPEKYHHHISIIKR